jgi:DNA-directed RNA polymerase II subunit RPB2
MNNLKGNDARVLAKELLETYFKTNPYPFTSHHINSFDQFMSEGLPSILRSRNPILLLKDLISDPDSSKPVYRYKVEIFVGGKDGRGISIGTPTIALQSAEEVRVLFPNEARLRNLSYRSTVMVDMYIQVTMMAMNARGELEPKLLPPIELKKEGDLDERIPLFKIPIMLHSRYCILNNKPAEFLREAGECEYDYGGYFIVDGQEKILITTQEQAFNTLYISNQEHDPKIQQYATISCLSPVTREVKRVAFYMNRMSETLQVQIPFVRKPLPVFILFRAMGVQSDKDILRLIFPNPESAEAKILEPLLLPSIVEAYPFTDTHLAVQFIKILTKGFSEAHVLDILHNQLFIHIEDLPGARVSFLADCVRQILRVHAKIDTPTNRDDTRNQRCLTSGFLIQMLFNELYNGWIKRINLAIDKEYVWKKTVYSNEKFLDIFQSGNRNSIFETEMMTEALMRAFKGKWGSGYGDEREGALQGLSRLSYHDFLSHCRRCVLEFDTTLKLPGPRRLNPSQYGYFCTSETPTGANIGITKNLSMMTMISTGTDPRLIMKWLLERGGVIACKDVNDDSRIAAVPMYVNGGILGYTLQPQKLTQVLKLFKWTGCLPAVASVGFNIRDRRVFLYVDEGRPCRPLIHLGPDGTVPLEKLRGIKKWRDLVMGTYGTEQIRNRGIMQGGFLDPLTPKVGPTLDEYIAELTPHMGVIEYVDPYEQNEIFIANYPELITPTSSHLEIHPSTIVGLMTSMIPFSNHNQSPRNQLSCSQSKQGLSIYSTNYINRFDNQVHVLCYPEAPLCRTLYYDYVADGSIGYGNNLILAIGCFTGYNQDDAIVMNADSIARGLFRNMTFRSYSAFEEDDEKAQTETRIANPANVVGWTELSPGLDYSKLGPNGIVERGSYVDENTVIVGRYLRSKGGKYSDASVTPQVWTSGRVEEVVVTVDNWGHRLVKVRVVQDRIPELGDKFSNRHGQKGTIGMLVRSHDMPRTAEGLVPDMIMNPHAIPSRMTIAQLLETLFGKCASLVGAVANGTAFMNDGDPSVVIGDVLEKGYGLERYGNEILYDGTTGTQIPSSIFIGQCYTMRLKHMTEDKWNARAEGRREQRTHQPTGGRGNEGGLRIGEMERDAIVGHGLSLFTRESFMKRGDGETFLICNGCGTIPIYNEKDNFYVCPLCDGPVQFSGNKTTTFELLPPNKRSLVTFSRVEMPYVVKLLEQELSTYMNIGMRFLTAKNVAKFPKPDASLLQDDLLEQYRTIALPDLQEEEVEIPERLPPVAEGPEADEEDLAALGVAPPRKEAALEGEEEAALEAETAARLATAAAAYQESTAAANAARIQTLAQVQAQAQALGGNVLVVPGLARTAAGPLEFAAAGTPLATPTATPPPPPPPAMTAAPAQVQIIQNVPLLPQGAAVLGSAVPGAPTTIVVDTSPGAMQQQGLSQFALPPPAAALGSPRNEGSAANRNRTRRAARPGGNAPSMFNAGQPAANPMGNAKVTVQKLGV